jgi:hypothetical protein
MTRTRRPLIAKGVSARHGYRYDVWLNSTEMMVEEINGELMEILKTQRQIHAKMLPPASFFLREEKKEPEPDPKEPDQKEPDRNEPDRKEPDRNEPDLICRMAKGPRQIA